MSIWIEAARGLWIGDVGRPFRDEFDHVLTISDLPPLTDDGLRHKHLPIPVRPDEIHATLDQAVGWLTPRWQAQRHLLVQSPGYSWAEKVVAALYVHLGAGADEAISSLRQVRAGALAEQQFRDLLLAREVRHV